jgi:pimeloyl-ACP methyl ester carboxylesterase
VKPSVPPARGVERILRNRFFGSLFVAAAKSGLMNRLILKSMAGSWYPDMSREDKQDVMEQVRDTMKSGTRIAWHGVASSPMGDDFVDTPEQLRFPLMYIYGERSELMTSFVRPNIEYLKEHVPHALIRRIDKGVHNCHIQKPEETAELLREFVSNLENDISYD